MAKIFISHSHKDRAFVHRLARDLRHQKVEVWLDDSELQVGDDFAKKLDEAVAANDFLGVVVSTNSITSEWVHRELRLALDDEASRAGPKCCRS
ncbi:MAG TPA: toll/interleukin-1 receptor domain-containing protein [Vicinamibacterales bacterium]|jgi:hypothetical protein|nr:toll/interleukin-1 receptor domain-containing protein [Vicinamibacterales bacterium]